MNATPEVLFVCVHNQGRSQMAAALLDHHGAGRVHVRSAGSAPADSVNPAVVEVMAELGIDLSRELPRKLLTADVEASDRSEEHTSELQSLMRISYAVFCLKNKKTTK